MLTEAQSCGLGPSTILSISAVGVTTSTPASPGTTTPIPFREYPPENFKSSEIEPPTRPKSTPFPPHDPSPCAQKGRFNNENGPLSNILLREDSHLAEQIPSARVTFSNLPTEIHEFILDHLFGVRASIANKSTSFRGWSTALRHSRRRQLSDLALINRSYRELVQGRLFKHIKVQGTKPSISDALIFFCEHPHLGKYPRHIEVWSPVWERRGGHASDHVVLPPTTPERTTLIRVMNAHVAGFEPSSNVTSAYQLASRNSTLYEIFQFVELAFPSACVLTLEGGHCKKPPMVKHFPDDILSSRKLPVLPKIRTLLLKSSWNIMRTEEDFDTIMAALPNIREWHTNYAKPKSKSYLNIARIVPKLSSSITHLNISLESTYSREAISPRFWRKIYPHQSHICLELAKAIPQLESFSYCGRICHQFFNQIVRLTDPERRAASKLKAIDLTVKNCCRPPSVVLDGTGISDSAFIAALETLVISSIRSLDRLPALSSLRIRFVDLESPMPLLNPFFQLKGNDCSGLWSDDILTALSMARPTASYLELSEDFGGVTYDKEGKLVPGATFPRTRPLSMKVASYEALSNEIAIN